MDPAKGKHACHRKLLDKNCAAMAARLPKAGGGDDFARKHSQQLVWWSTDVIEYANPLAARLRSLRPPPGDLDRFRRVHRNDIGRTKPRWRRQLS